MRRDLALGHAGEVSISAKMLELLILLVMGCFGLREETPLDLHLARSPPVAGGGWTGDRTSLQSL